MKYCILVILSVFLSHCGAWPRKHHGHKGDGFTRTTYGTPVVNPFYSDACQTTPDVSAFNELSLQTYNDHSAALAPASHNFNGTSAASYGLRTGIVEATSFNLKGRSSGSLDLSSDEITLHLHGKFENPLPLRVCLSNGEMPRGTKEAVGLSSAMHINRAHAFYKKAPNHRKDLKAVNLDVLPDMYSTSRTHIKKESGEEEKLEFDGWETDNAAWSIGFADGQPSFSITVYPQSEEYVEEEKFSGYGLWEVPYVVMHEFGHHVFYRHYPRLFDADGSKIARNLSNLNHGQGLVFNERGLTRKLLQVPELKDRAYLKQNYASEDFMSATVAVNEGFADLFAFFASDSKSASTNLSCFRQTRDIASSTFPDKREKQLTKHVLTHFLEGKVDEALPGDDDGECRAYQWADVHIIGAIIGHGFNELVVAKLGNKADAVAKLTHLLQWVDALNTNYRPGELGPLAYMRDATMHAAKVAATAGVLNAAQCDVLRKVFPEFYSYWKTNKGDFAEFAVCK